MNITINQIRNAKSLKFEVVDEDGNVWARVISRPLAEKFVPIIEETHERAAAAIAGLIEESP